MARPPYTYSLITMAVKTVIVAIRDPRRAEQLVEQVRAFYIQPYL